MSDNRKYYYIELLEKRVKRRKYVHICPQAPTRARARIFTVGLWGIWAFVGGNARMPFEMEWDADIRLGLIRTSSPMKLQGVECPPSGAAS